MLPHPPFNAFETLEGSLALDVISPEPVLEMLYLQSKFDEENECSFSILVNF